VTVLSQATDATFSSPVGSAIAFDHEEWQASNGGQVDSTGKWDNVSAVWRGTINFQGGDYVFHTWSDDGSEVTVDGNVIISNWWDHGAEQHDSSTITLSAGNHTVQMRYYESGGDAVAGLWWDYTPAANSSPSSPTISCSGCGGSFPNFTGTANTNYTFNISATDPDLDQVAFGVDWNSDWGPDEGVPLSGYVNSGVPASTIHNWSSVGTQSFNVFSYDTAGNYSSWVTANITLASGQVNGTCGSANKTYASSDTSYGTDTLCQFGTVINCSQGTAPNCSFPAAGSSVTWTCQGSGGGSSAACAASRPAAATSVNVTVSNLAGGSVSSNPAGINCGSSCTTNVTIGSVITLTATPASSYWQFSGWGGDCAAFGKSKICVLTVNATKNVSANFSPRLFNYNEF
jgi:hypothetical protein